MKPDNLAQLTPDGKINGLLKPDNLAQLTPDGKINGLIVPDGFDMEPIGKDSTTPDWVNELDDEVEIWGGDPATWTPDWVNELEDEIDGGDPATWSPSEWEFDIEDDWIDGGSKYSVAPEYRDEWERLYGDGADDSSKALDAEVREEACEIVDFAVDKALNHDSSSLWVGGDPSSWSPTALDDKQDVIMFGEDPSTWSPTALDDTPGMD